MAGATPSQTIGPFFHDALTDGEYASFTNRLVPEGTPGGIIIVGEILDGAGETVPDAMVEILHLLPDEADTMVFGRSDTRDGGFRFFTVKPGARSGEAPFINVSVFARGLLKRLVTRIYFPGENNPRDPVFMLAGEAAYTLIATAEGENAYRFEIRLQGDGQTVFFDV